MKSFILSFSMISCFLLSQGLSLQSTMTTTTVEALTTTPINVTSSDAPAPAVEVARPFGKAVTPETTTTTTTTTTKSSKTTKGPGQQCKEIGSACSVSDECCSLRCTSYRRRCAY